MIEVRVECLRKTGRAPGIAEVRAKIAAGVGVRLLRQRLMRLEPELANARCAAAEALHLLPVSLLRAVGVEGAK
jgi:hypothetical protein